MHLHDPLQLAMGASLNEHATPAAFSCTCIHDIVFSPRKRKSLLSLPFADRVPLISNDECALQAHGCFALCMPWPFGNMAAEVVSVATPHEYCHAFASGRC